MIKIEGGLNMKQNSLHHWHIEHNKQVAEFHKKHEIEIQQGENGNSLLAKWERYFYNKVISPLKK